MKKILLLMLCAVSTLNYAVSVKNGTNKAAGVRYIMSRFDNTPYKLDSIQPGQTSVSPQGSTVKSVIFYYPDMKGDSGEITVSRQSQRFEIAMKQRPFDGYTWNDVE